MVIALIAAYAGGTAYAGTRYDASKASYESASSAYSKKVDEANKLAKDAKGKVLDDTTIQALTASTKRSGDAPGTNANRLLLWDVIKGTNGYSSSSDALSSDIKDIDAAIAKVNASIDAKSVKDAKDALAKGIDDAKKLLADSNNKVADNATRDSLTKAIDTAAKALASTQLKPADLVKAYTTPIKPLQDATKAVTDSIQAKSKADADAKAAADAQAQAQSSANASNSGSGYSTGGSNSYNYSNTSGGSPGYSAPAPSYTAPKQSTAPAPSNNGGSTSGGSSSGGTADLGPTRPGSGNYWVPITIE